MRESIADLALDKLFIVSPGTERYLIHENVEVTPVHEITGNDLGGS